MCSVIEVGLGVDEVAMGEWLEVSEYQILCAATLIDSGLRESEVGNFAPIKSIQGQRRLGPRKAGRA